jgi:endonuclease III
MAEHKRVVRRLLDAAGKTYAAEAGVRVSDRPMPLFQLLVLCMLASKPIDATIAMRAGRELFRDGLKTPKAVLAADRQTMIKAFGRAHYVRYDESSATRLTEMAQRVIDDHSGDLRDIARGSSEDVRPARSPGCLDLGAPVLRQACDEDRQSPWTAR